MRAKSFLPRVESSGFKGFGKTNTEEVYVIIRVFNLDKDTIGMRVYVDPAAMDVTGQLKFTAEQWSVVPGRRTSGYGVW
jgi:hypothetical protein